MVKDIIVNLPRVGYTGKSHFRAWDLGLRAADIVFERRLVPDKA